MKAIINDLLDLPYTPNQYGQALHEDKIEEVFVSHGFTKNDMRIRTAVRDELLADEDADLDGLENGEYISQPCGENNSPDFIVKENNKLYFFEAKSSAGTFPTYNGGLPKERYIYVFSSGKTNETTVFFGGDVLEDTKRGLLNDLTEELWGIVKKYQALPEWDNDSRGFDFYMRAMYTQSGGNQKKNYFTHADRQEAEARVLSYCE